VETSATSPSSPAPRKLHELLAPVWAERKRILLWSFVAGVITLLVNFFILDLTYKATTSLLPETEKGKLGMLSQFSGLAQLAGVNVPGSEVARLYPMIVTSETVLRPVIERTYQTQRYSQPVNLIQFFEIEEKTAEENMYKALKELRSNMTTSYENKTSTVGVTLEMEEPQLAADVLNAIVGELDRFMRLKRINTASEQAKWISSRLMDVERELRSAEEALKTFSERNRRISDSPELTLRQARLMREVTVKSTIAIELKKQFELAKIEEIKNITIVNVLDEARPPVKKERPKRATNAAFAFLLVLVGMGSYYAMKPGYEPRVREFVRGIRGKK
jgi:tyrosine-protein kinase Etk/Wzc